MKRAVLAASLAALLSPALAHAISIHAGFDRAITDSVLWTKRSKLAQPAYLDSVFDPFTGAKITRVTGDAGDAIPGVNGGAEWALGVRPHYSTDPAFSADGTMAWVMQDCDDPTKLVLDVETWDVIYTNKSTMTPYRAQLDSCSELRWHPVTDSLMFGYIREKGAVKKKLILFSMLTGITHKSWIFQITDEQNSSDKDEGGGNFGWQGDSDVSDDGRFVAFSTNFNWQFLVPVGVQKDIVILVDTMMDSTGAVGSRVGPAFEVDENPHARVCAGASSCSSADTWKSRQVGNVKVSALGNYVVVKYQSAYEFLRVLKRGTGLALDTTSVTLSWHKMHQGALRMLGAASDTSRGWIAMIQHPDVGLDASGREVVVGGLRNNDKTNWNATGPVQAGLPSQSQLVTHDAAKSDSGRFIAIDLATGQHRHVSGGRKVTRPAGTSAQKDEAADKHTSGRARLFRPWMLMLYDNDSESSGGTRNFSGMMVFWYVDSIFGAVHEHRGIIAGHHHSSFNYYQAEPHSVPSNDGTRIMFGSDWSDECPPGGPCGIEGEDEDCGDPLNAISQTYVLDMRSGGKREIWVKSGGDSTNNGFSAAYPAANFSRPLRLVGANNGSNVVVHVVAGGAVADFPQPVHTPAAGKRYYVYGNVGNPSLTTIGAAGTASMTMPYLSIAGVTIPADLSIVQPARFDTIRNSILGAPNAGVLSIDGADDLVIRNNTIRGQRLMVGRTAAGDARTVRLNLSNNTFSGLKASATEPALGFGRPGTTDRKIVDSLTFAGNVVTSSKASGTASHMRLSHVRNSTFRNNDYTFTTPDESAGGSNDGHLALAIRDSSFAVAFEADTFQARGSGSHNFIWSHQGALGMRNTVNRITVDSVSIYANNGVPLWFDDGADRATVTYTTAMVDGEFSAMRVPAARGNNTFDHLTLVSSIGNAPAAEAGVVNFGQQAFVSMGGTDSLRFTNNLVVSHATKANPVGFDESRVHGLYVDLTDLEGASTPLDSASARFVSDWNAYSVLNYVTTPGDRAIGFQTSADGNLGSPPGEGGAWEALITRRDSLSVYGSAQFDRGGRDSLVGGSLDPEPGIKSIVKERGKSGTDIGAVAVTQRPFLVMSTGTLRAFRDPSTLGRIDTLYVWLNNIGTANVTLSGLTESVADLTAALSSATVTPGDAVRLRLIFTPTTLTQRSIPIRFTTNDPRHPTVTLELRYNLDGGGGGTGELPLDG